MLSNYALIHELKFPEIHTFEDFAFLIGVFATIISMSYFLISKIASDRDRKKEHDAFMEDLLYELKDLGNPPGAYILTWDESKQQVTGRFGHYNLDTLSAKIFS